MARNLTVPNPASPRGLQPAHLITDRAKRYRANASPPPGPRRCHYCPSTSKNVDIDHIDGHEANGDQANLIYACRSCNTAKGLLFAKHGIGKRAVRYNPLNPAYTPPRSYSAGIPGPRKPHGVETLKQWAWAAEVVTGKISATPAEVREAASLISHTPTATRSRLAGRAWASRRKRAAA